MFDTISTTGFHVLLYGVAAASLACLGWKYRQLKMKMRQEVRAAQQERLLDRIEQKDEEYRYDTAIQLTSDGLWELDLEQDKALISDLVRDWFDLKERLVAKAAEHIIDRIHPDDWTTIPAQFIPENYDDLRRIIREHSGQTIFAELRLLHRSQEYRWVRVRLKVDLIGNRTRIFGSFLDIQDQKSAEAKIAQLSTYDSTTGLKNFSTFITAASEAVTTGQEHAVMILDLDNFRTINDVLGYFKGNDVLKYIAKHLQDHLPPGCQLFRFGADEFILLSDLTTSVEETVASLQGTLRTAMEDQNNASWLTMSIGVCCFPTTTTPDVETVIRQADLALGAAKTAGKNRSVRFTTAMQDQLEQRQLLIEKLKTAVDHLDLEVHYQPQIDLQNNRLNRVEALLRWNSEGQSISPAVFIQLAEETGLIVPIGQQVLQEACMQLQKWQEDGLDMSVAVNVSAIELRQPDYTAQLRATLVRTGVNPGRLTLEITETSVMDDVWCVREVLKELRAIGVNISLDDFGTGYSSLSHLVNLPIDEVKLDRSFIRDIHKDARRNSIVASFIQLAKSNNLLVVAEGVETEYEAAALLAYGCHFAQGYLYARAIPADQLAEVNTNLKRTALSIESITTDNDHTSAS